MERPQSDSPKRIAIILRLHRAECPHNIRGVGSSRPGNLLVTQPARRDVMHVVHQSAGVRRRQLSVARQTCSPH